MRPGRAIISAQPVERSFEFAQQMLAAQKASAMIDPPVNALKDTDTLKNLLAAEYNAIATYTAGAGIIAAATITATNAIA